MVTEGFVQVPHTLINSLPDAELRLWIIVRRATGERLDPCWATLKTLDKWMRCGRASKHVSSRLRFAQRELRKKGLLVVKRWGPYQSAHRWALWPGTKGDSELQHMFDAKQILRKLYEHVLARRDASVLSERSREDATVPGDKAPQSRLSGRQHPAKQNQLNRTLQTGAQENPKLSQDNKRTEQEQTTRKQTPDGFHEEWTAALRPERGPADRLP